MTGLEVPRGSSTKNMANHLQKLGVTAYDVHLAESVPMAFQQAMNESQPDDCIVVFGSFHTVALVLECLT